MTPAPQQERCYGLPKLYKNNMPMHPIVSVCGTATWSTAKFITKILQNCCGKTSSFVKDSTNFIQKIKHLSITPQEETLVHFHVSSLFTTYQHMLHYKLSIPKLSISTHFTNDCKIPTEKFIKFLEFTIINCIFCFNKKFYKQLQDAAMGSSVSPVSKISTWNTLKT